MAAYQTTIGGAMNPQKHTMSVLAQIASWIPDKFTSSWFKILFVWYLFVDYQEWHLDKIRRYVSGMFPFRRYNQIHWTVKKPLA